MPTVQTGPRGTIDLLEDLIVQEMMRKVAVLETSSKPLTTLMNNLMKVIQTDTPEPQHTEDELQPTVDLVTGVHTAAAVALNIDNPTFFLPGDLIHFPHSGEVAYVTLAAGVSPITIRRGIGQTPPAAIPDNSPVWILGGASEEGARSRDALNTLEIPFEHRCQIIRNSIEATGTQLATRQLGGDFDDQAEKKLIEHKRQMEHCMKFGRQDRVTINNQYMRTMGGILERVQINRFAVNGILEEGTWEAFLEMGFSYSSGSARKLFIAAPRVLRAIGNFSRGRLLTVPEDESYGLVLRRYESNSGVVDLISDREFKGTVYGGYGLLFDPDFAVVRYLRAGPGSGRPAKYQGSAYCKRIENIQDSDGDRRKDEYFSELCLQMIHERVHAVITGVRG